MRILCVDSIYFAADLLEEKKKKGKREKKEEGGPEFLETNGAEEHFHSQEDSGGPKEA